MGALSADETKLYALEQIGLNGILVLALAQLVLCWP